MRNRILLAEILLLAMLLSGCSSSGYLPSVKNLGVNQYGSLIMVRVPGQYFDGELIAIENEEIIILSPETNTCVSIPMENVKKFKLTYAKSTQYGWTIPLLTISAFSHGIIGISTLPLNLIVTIWVTIAGNNATRYTDKKMTYEELKMFARFPQGIPEGLDLSSIRGKEYN